MRLSFGSEDHSWSIISRSGSKERCAIHLPIDRRCEGYVGTLGSPARNRICIILGGVVELKLIDLVGLRTEVVQCDVSDILVTAVVVDNANRTLFGGYFGFANRYPALLPSKFFLTSNKADNINKCRFGAIREDVSVLSSSDDG